MNRGALIALLGLIPVLAHADGPRPAAVWPECYCTDSTGGRIEMGQSICLSVGGRSFTAQCQMSLNVPMWRETAPGCLSSSLTRGKTLPQSFAPGFDPGTVDAQI